MSGLSKGYPYWQLSTLYFFYFALLGAFAPYWSLYLQDKGYNAESIGLLTAIVFLTKIIAPNVWALIADYTRRRVMVIRLGFILSALCFAPIIYAVDFLSLALLLVLYSFFWNAILPQMEVVTLSYLKIQPQKYGRIRLWGSIGFILVVVFLGWLFEKIQITWLPVIMVSLILFACMVSFLLKEPAPVFHKASGKGFLSVLKNPYFSGFFIVCLLMQMSHGAYYTFYTIYLVDVGYSNVQVGWLWGVGVIAEVVLFIFVATLLKRFEATTVVLVSLMLTSIRWFLIAEFSDNLVVIVFAQCLHAASYGSFHAGAIHFIHTHFKGAHESQAQALYSGISFGLGGAMGAALSGYLWNDIGAGNVYLISSGVAAFAVFILLMSIPNRAKRHSDLEC